VTRRPLMFLSAVLLAIIAFGCAHYPVNQPLKHVIADSGYRPALKHQQRASENSDSLLLYLSFSGGGTRAAALSYGVLEELRRTEVVIDGKKRRLLDEIDSISSVSGGSFTAAYYGLFGDRIFEDFERKFLKKNIQGDLAVMTYLNPVNWFRLASAFFDRSDLAAEYYDKHVFDGKTFADFTTQKGPYIVINTTEMTHGVRVGFTQDIFDNLCSDLSSFPVARAAAASSAVPMLLTPITVHNYAGTCEVQAKDRIEEVLRDDKSTQRLFYLANSFAPFLDSSRKSYLHLVDGGVADNLGLRAVLDRVIAKGSCWGTIKGTPAENSHRVAFIIVNAETQPDTKWDRLSIIPPFSAMLASYSTIAIERYNQETIALLKESVKSWADEIRRERCKGGQPSSEPGSCGDIEIYVIEVKFDALKDEAKRLYFQTLPTSFVLAPGQVDELRNIAHQILTESEEFQSFLHSLH
jgi:NTE family protein